MSPKRSHAAVHHWQLHVDGRTHGRRCGGLTEFWEPILQTSFAKSTELDLEDSYWLLACLTALHSDLAEAGFLIAPSLRHPSHGRVRDAPFS